VTDLGRGRGAGHQAQEAHLACPACPSLPVSRALRGCAAGRRAAMLGACVRVGRHWSAGWTRGGSRGRVSARASCQSNSWQSGVTVEQLTAMPSPVRRFRLVSRCEAVGEMARGLRHAGELLAATICASLRAARGPRVCGASGARPRSRFTGGRSFGRPAASQQDPADVCKPGSSVANSTVCVRVRVPAQMQRCVGLPGVGRPAGDAFRRRACPRALLRTDPDQNRYFKVYPTGLWRSPQIFEG
jgi:hypothetical protein